MPQARDEAGNIWETDDQGNPIRLIQAAQPARQATVFEDPIENTRSAAEARSAEAGAAMDVARTPYADQFAEAEVRRAQAEAAAAEESLERGAEEEARSEQGRSRGTAGRRRAGQTVLRSVTRALELLKEIPQGDGIIGANARIASSRIPGTPAYDLNRQLEDFKRNIGLDRLQEMRDSSPTGGALGQVPVQQQAMLEDTMGSFHLGQDIDVLRENLNQLNNNYLEIMYGTPDERASLIESGEITPDFAREIESSYRDVNFDALGRRVIAGEAGSAPQEDGEAPGLTGTVTDTTPSPYDPGGELNVQTTAPYQESILGQGVSGINEGMAGLLGLPVDAATFAINLVPQGINAIANTDLATIENPALGGDWFRDQMQGWGIYDRTDDPTQQFVRRVGESIGASAIPVGAAANTGRQAIAGLLAATGGGLGGATAQQVAPGNIGAEIAGELIGSAVPGAGLARAGQRMAQREIESAIPTTRELQEQADQLYKRAERSGVVAGPQQTTELADNVRRTLRREGQLGPSGRISDADSSSTKALNLIEQYEGQQMTPTEMNTIRKVISDGRSSADASDRRIARILLDEFDEFAAPLAPEFEQARGAASRQLSAMDLERARELAQPGASQFTGAGIENALRTQYRGLDRGMTRGTEYFAPPVADAIRNVSRGTPASNFARNVGRLAPSNVLSSLAGSGVGGALGASIGGPVGGMVGGAIAPIAGGIGRSAATRMTERGADIAELIARSGGPIEQAPLISDDASRLIAALLAGQAAGTD